MITPLQFPIYRQGNILWSGQRLGTVNGTTLGGFGCLVSSLAMVSSAFGQVLNPAQVDDLFTGNNGYANGNLVIWNAVTRLLPQITQLGTDYCESTPAPIAKIKGHLDAGGLALLRVNFGGVAGKMHWIVADGYNGDNIIKTDPWYGDETDFTSKSLSGHFRYGTGDASRDILEVHYLKDSQPNVVYAPVAPPVEKPVATLPVEIPPTIPEAPVETVPSGSSTIEPTGQVTAELPVTVIVQAPDYQATYSDQPSTRIVLRPSYTPFNAETGGPTYTSVAVGYAMTVAGYFTYEGREYARSTFALLTGSWIGLSVDAFLPPNGQASGDVSVTAVPASPESGYEVLSSAQGHSRMTEFWEALARLIAAVINKRSSH